MASKQAQPHRVVSLLPAAAEYVGLLGAEDLLVGRGHGDDFPPSVEKCPPLTTARHPFTTSLDVDVRVTETMQSGEGMYVLDGEQLKQLQPTVVITQGLCSVCAIDESLIFRIAKQIEPPPDVVSLSPACVEDIISDVTKVGEALGIRQVAEAAQASLQRRVDAAIQHVKRGGEGGEKPPVVVFMEWTEPIYCGGHWTPQIIEMAGGVHPLNPTRNGRGATESFRVPPEKVVAADPDWIIVCPCGLDIPTTKVEMRQVESQDWWLGLRAVQQGRVVLVDGNHMFNRSGPRIIDALEWMVGLLNNVPAIMPPNFPWEQWTPPPLPGGVKSSPGASAGENGVNGAGPGGHLNGSANGAAGDKSVARGGEGAGAGAAAGGGGGEGEGGDAEDVIGGIWRAPVLSPDVEEAHSAACQKRQSMYTDPHTGYMVFTAGALKARTTCCGNACRHCPFGHFNVPSWRGPRSNTMQEAVYSSTAKINNSLREREGSYSHRPWVLLPWAADVASWLALQALEDEAKAASANQGSGANVTSADGCIALLVCFDPSTGRVLGGGPFDALPVSIRAVMDQALHLQRPLLAVPVESSPGGDAQKAIADVAAALRLVPGQVAELVDAQAGNGESYWQQQGSLLSQQGVAVRPLPVMEGSWAKERSRHLDSLWARSLAGEVQLRVRVEAEEEQSKRAFWRSPKQIGDIQLAYTYISFVPR